MKTSNIISRPALRYYGGKWRLGLWIISHFPKHTNYVEPCGGAASILLQKPRSRLEVYNDLDTNVVNFFKVLRDIPQKLINAIKLTPWSKEEYNISIDFTSPLDPVEKARRFYVSSWQSISGGPNPQSSGWRCVTQGDFHKLDTDHWKCLSFISNRLLNVLIENDDMLSVIKHYDNEDTLIYFDPPYTIETRAHKKRYNIEINDQDHIEAARLFEQCKSYVIVSGYRNELYDSLYKGWRREDIESLTNGKKRIESIWLSPKTAKALRKPKQIQLAWVEGWNHSMEVLKNSR